jgi:hypothetical protein
MGRAVPTCPAHGSAPAPEGTVDRCPVGAPVLHRGRGKVVDPAGAGQLIDVGGDPVQDRRHLALLDRVPRPDKTGFVGGGHGGSSAPKTASACTRHNPLTLWRRPGSFSPHTAGRPHIQHAPPGDGTRSTPPALMMAVRRAGPGREMHHDRGAVHAGDLEQGGKDPGGPARVVEREPGVPAAGVAVVSA